MLSETTNSLESPVVPQNVCEEPLVHVGRDSIDVRMRRHYCPNAGFLYGCLERRQEHFIHHSLGNIHVGFRSLRR